MSNAAPETPGRSRLSIEERLKRAGLGDLPYVKVTRNAPTPAEERKGNVVAGICSVTEGLLRASALLDAWHAQGPSTPTVTKSKSKPWPWP